MTTDVAFCNQALNLIGAGVIASFEEGSDKSLTCALQYERVVTTLLTMTPWSFCKKKRRLSRLSKEPVNGYEYQYQLPADALSGPYAVYNSSAIGAIPMQTGWAIFGSAIMSNEQEIYIDYLQRVDESKFPVWFGSLLVLALAGAFAKAITDQNDLAIEYNQRAFGPPSDNMRGGYFRVCTQINRQMSGSQAIPSSELVAARHSL